MTILGECERLQLSLDVVVEESGKQFYWLFGGSRSINQNSFRCQLPMRLVSVSRPTNT